MKDYSGLIKEYEAGRLSDWGNVYPESVNALENGIVFMADEGGGDVLVSSAENLFEGERKNGCTIAPLSHKNADALRKLFPFTKPVRVLSRDASCGVGDRLGIAGDGHIRVFRDCGVAPVLAQQSMRELSLTKRTFADVIDAATFAVFRNGYRTGFGADGDHLKTMPDIRAALEMGCTMITLDCSEHIHKDGRTPSEIYDEAIDFATDVWNEFFAKDEYGAELEISIDETDTPTTPEQHRYIAEKLRSRNVGFVTLAPRFCGEFQKGIDYIGDLAQFEREFKEHQLIAEQYGYKLSIHSGSDKFSVFPIIAKYAKGRFHLKTAGTNWLEAMRITAAKDPALYREAHAYALEKFEDAKKFYHVTTDLTKIPALDTLTDDMLPELFDNNDARQLIHITYGYILQNDALRERLYTLWRMEREAYSDALYAHIGKHIELITGKPLRGCNK